MKLTERYAMASKPTGFAMRTWFDFAKSWIRRSPQSKMISVRVRLQSMRAFRLWLEREIRQTEREYADLKQEVEHQRMHPDIR